MPAANERPQIAAFPTPVLTDVLLVENRASKLASNDYKLQELGQPHPDTVKWPDHELVWITPIDEDGNQKWYYAAKRECQDLYNFEFHRGGVGGFKFDSLERTYFYKREDFNENFPVLGSANPNHFPEGRFDNGYILFERKQVRSPEKELDSLYVMEVRTYARRVTLTEVKLDLESGRSKRSITNLYYRGEVVDGLPVEDLAADPGGPYWGQQTNGAFRELNQISTDWFEITESNVLPTDAVIDGSNPARSRIISRVTPLGTDVIFTEVGAMPTPPPAYGTAHYDTTNWPNHKLVFIEPADQSGLLYRFTYAADRPNQNLYNFEDQNGESMTRTYIIPRATYYNQGTYLPTVPTVGTADATFTRYVFAAESVKRIGSAIDGLYVAVERLYLPLTRVDKEYNVSLERNVITTRKVIPHGTGTASNVAGKLVEIQDVNTWYDLEITREIAGFGSVTYPITLTPIPIDVPYRFPRRLNSIRFVYAYAAAIATGQRPAYDESIVFDFDISDPANGPYEGVRLRFITNNPDALRATYPVVKINAKSESVPYTRAWAIADTDNGNIAQAQAELLTIPETIHPALTISFPGPGPIGTGGLSNSDYKTSLPATPNYTAIASATTMVVGYETTQLPLNLWQVDVIRINTNSIWA